MSNIPNSNIPDNRPIRSERGVIGALSIAVSPRPTQSRTMRPPILFHEDILAFGLEITQTILCKRCG